MRRLILLSMGLIAVVGMLSVAPSQAVLLVDTFTRPDSTDLGTTEDPNAWIWKLGKGENGASITNEQLVLADLGFNGVSPGAFKIADFELNVCMSVKKYWDGGWGGFVYRSSTNLAIDGQTGGDGSGYIFHVGGAGAHDVLYIWSGQTGHIAGVQTGLDWSKPQKVRLLVVGDSHKVWLNDNPVPIVDVKNGNKTSEGYLFFCRRDDGAAYDCLSVTVPEPGSAVVFLTGLTGMLGLLRRKS